MPYLNITARWDGAPDQDLLGEKGGRGFPYCTIMNADGDVIWEVRPTSREVLQEGLANAKALQALKERLKAKPDDAGLAASVEIMTALGCQQRETKPMAELEELAKVEGLDADVKARFDEWIEGKKFEELLNGIMEKATSQEDVGASFLKLYQDGVRPPAGSQTAMMYWYYCTSGAVAAQDKEAATACVTELGKLAEGDERLGQMVADLKKQIDEIE